MVVCKAIIIFVAIKEIESANTKADCLDRLFQAETINIKIIDMNEFYDKESIAGGVIVNVVNQTDLNLIEQLKIRQNVIQISMLDHVLFWDLDEDEEVSRLSGYN